MVNPTGESLESLAVALPPFEIFEPVGRPAEMHINPYRQAEAGFLPPIRSGNPKELKPCDGRLSCHLQGKKLDVLRQLQHFSTYLWFVGAPTTEKQALVGLTKWVIARRISKSRFRAWEIVKALFRDGWLTFQPFSPPGSKKVFIAVYVRPHQEWAASNDLSCQFSDGQKGQTEREKGQIERKKGQEQHVSSDSAELTGARFEALEVYTLKKKEEEQDESSEVKLRSSAAHSKAEKQEKPSEAENPTCREKSAVESFAEGAFALRVEREYGRPPLYGKSLLDAAAVVKKLGIWRVLHAYGRYLDDDRPFLKSKKHPWGFFFKQFETDWDKSDADVRQDYTCAGCGERRWDFVSVKNHEDNPPGMKCFACRQADADAAWEAGEAERAAERQEKAMREKARFEALPDDQKIAELKRELRVKEDWLSPCKSSGSILFRNELEAEIKQLRLRLEALESAKFEALSDAEKLAQLREELLRNEKYIRTGNEWLGDSTISMSEDARQRLLGDVRRYQARADEIRSRIAKPERSILDEAA